MVMLLIFKSFELNEKIVCLEMDICLYLNTKYCWFTFFIVTSIFTINRKITYKLKNVSIKLSY
jgi:hypothetical protein